MLTLTELAAKLGELPNRRKILLYVGPGERFDPRVLTAAATPGVSAFASGAMATIFSRMQNLFRQAQRANVNVYTFDVNGLSAPGPGEFDPRKNQREFLQIVARETGARSVTGDNAPGREAGRILAENASYYLIGFRSTNAAADGSYRRLEVKVSRGGMTVRSRRGYFSPKSGGRPD